MPSIMRLQLSTISSFASSDRGSFAPSSHHSAVAAHRAVGLRRLGRWGIVLGKRRRCGEPAENGDGSEKMSSASVSCLPHEAYG